MPNPKIEISCFTCRKCKHYTIIHVDVYSCVHRLGQNFTYSSAEDKPCENWLPSKADIKLKLARANDN